MERYHGSPHTRLLHCCAFGAALFLLAASSARSDTHYVSPSGGHSAPFTNWVDAATDIQSAVNAASPGDTILVTNGVYSTGWTAVVDLMRNRVAVTKAVTVRSVNGPSFTHVVGQGPIGNSAVRCAYLGAGARLEGFTLTQGYTRSAGDNKSQQSGGGAWCEPGAVLSNCMVLGNRAIWLGGGSYGGTLEGCVVSNNMAYLGGGAYSSSLWNSTVIANRAYYDGFASGGGLFLGTADNCRIADNAAEYDGGGIVGVRARNCSISGNTAEYYGGAAYSELEHCTVIGNQATWDGGGTGLCTTRSSIVYYNVSDYGMDNDLLSLMEFSCTTPDPGGAGNFTNEPGLVSLAHPFLLQDSPCVDRGPNPSWADGTTDIEGEPRIINSLIDVGCDEVNDGSLTGALQVACSSSHAQVSAGFPVRFEAEAAGRAAGYQWIWGDGWTDSNTLVIAHAYELPGLYDVIFEAWNLDGTGSATVSVEVVAAFTNYVSATGGHAPPFATWANASTNLQDAVAEHLVPGGVVMVTNGVYDAGGAVVQGSLSNRVALTNAIHLCSVNGPEVTRIVGRGPIGDDAVRCAYVVAGARLTGFMLTNGHTRSAGDFITQQCGGGVLCEAGARVDSCLIVSNRAERGGGGAYRGRFTSCRITGNYAIYGGGCARGLLEDCLVDANDGWQEGGGLYYSTARGCDLIGNVSTEGGGAFGGECTDCFISNNYAADGAGLNRGFARRCRIVGNHWGEGAYEATLLDCAVLANEGGGMWWGVAKNCTITSNGMVSAYGGGMGTYETRLERCIVYHNTANGEALNCVTSGFEPINYTCTFPDPGGIGNITNDPGFVGLSDLDVRLDPRSPCIDAGGTPSWAVGMTDLDGLPRIINDAVDLGAFESPSPRVTGIQPVGPNQVAVRWLSFDDARYAVDRAADPAGGFSTRLQSGIPATPPVNAFTTSVAGAEAGFYRVEYTP